MTDATKHNGGLEEVGTTSRGYTIFREVNEVGGHRYWSDEIGGGVMVWDTCLADSETLRRCLEIEAALAHAREAGAQEPVAVPAGWKLVPTEPTPEMIDAWHRASWPTGPSVSPLSQQGLAFVRYYDAMLSAAPIPPAGGDVRGRKTREELEKEASIGLERVIEARKNAPPQAPHANPNSCGDVTGATLATLPAEPEGEKPKTVKMLVSADWLRRKIEEDPDLPCEAGSGCQTEFQFRLALAEMPNGAVQLIALRGGMAGATPIGEIYSHENDPVGVATRLAELWNSALSPALAAEEAFRRGAEETGWLIELKGSRPTWWCLGWGEEPGWSRDAGKALRFARKVDAEAYIDDTGWTEAFASEHVWCATPSHPEGREGA